MNNKRLSYGIGIALLLGFSAFAFTEFKATLTPYVSFADATRMTRSVQVAGALVKQSSSYDQASESLLFTLREATGGDATLRVRYHGLKPANFEDAISIVAIGQYEPGNQELVAHKLLVKCPSKYQGAEVEEKTYS